MLEEKRETGRRWQWLSSLLFGLPLDVKIMGMALGIIILFGTMSLLTIHDTLVFNMEELLEKESRSIAVELAHRAPEYLLIHDIYGLSQMLKSTVKSRPDLRYAVVSDRHDQIVAHTFGAGFPADLLEFHHRAGGSPSEVTLQKIKTNEGIIWESTAPVMQGDEGRVRVGVREDAFRQQIGNFLYSFALSSFWVVIIGLLLSAYLTWLITRPILQLLQATQAVNQGNYQIRLPLTAKDEVGRLTLSFNEMVAQLERADESRREKEQMRREFLQRVIAGQENERQRIARELHDQTGQALASITLGLKMLENNTSDQATRDNIGDLKKAVTAEIQTLHDLAVTLRPSILDDMGLIPALEVLFNDLYKRHGLKIQPTIIGFARRRAESCLETCIYRIIQEALLNVLRHAEADTATVLLDWRGSLIRGVIEDNGRGFDPANAPSDRLGLYGMRERAELAGGFLRIESEPGQGTMVVFELPS
ncbi:MAG: ATP-binding protein [Desulfurivibrio sp.]